MSLLMRTWFLAVLALSMTACGFSVSIQDDFTGRASELESQYVAPMIEAYNAQDVETLLTLSLSEDLKTLMNEEIFSLEEATAVFKILMMDVSGAVELKMANVREYKVTQSNGDTHNGVLLEYAVTAETPDPKFKFAHFIFADINKDGTPQIVSFYFSPELETNG